MNRRDFLRLRTTERGRTLELSCRNLYMRYLDCEGAAGATDSAIGDHESWMGEPPAVFTKQSAEAMWSLVEDDLKGADVLRLVDHEWLAATGLRDRVDQIVEQFRARGGRVED